MNSSENETIEEESRVEHAGVQKWAHHVINPTVLFTLIAVVLLAVIWSVTVNLVARERLSAQRAARTLVADLTDTYEAQVMRALGEIDNTLKLVRYEMGAQPSQRGLQHLASEGLLPPDLLFTVNVTDARGNVIASNPPDSNGDLGGFDFVRRTQDGTGMTVNQPRRDKKTGEWDLYFSRSLVESNRRLTSGVVVVSVQVDFFVSGYEQDAMGDHGVLGILGTDGLFYVKRTGDKVTVGEEVDYDSLVDDGASVSTPAEVITNPWDGVRRFTVARKLYDLPLAIVVALSETEQLASVDRIEDTYIWRASMASLLVFGVVALLGRLSWQLQRASERAMEEQIANARRVEYLAYHDNLTDLPNRALFSRLLAQAIRYARRYKKGLALLFLDLDRFKAINDSLGHEAGDKLLQEVGRRLQSSVRQSDVVARIAGDEFVVLLPETESGSEASSVAEKILLVVSSPFALAGQEFRISVSVGISLFPNDGGDEETLMKCADTAMYNAKGRGRNNYQFFSEELKADSLERLALESSLRNALEKDEFRLFYQAKRDMTSGKVSGLEALLRWQHPDLGLIAPMRFIPLAEEIGLIIPIGRWVLITACRQNVAWQDEGFPTLCMAVNLSARQFLDDVLIDDVATALRESGMDPKLLELEISESVIMQDMKRTIHIIKELKDMGVRVAIDDFGTGYSSLSILKQFPLDTIKIDGSFIHDMVCNAENRGLAEAVITLGKSLCLTVIAEGVETSEQVDFLRAHACDEFQGFYINKPMPADEFANLVREQVTNYSRRNVF